MEQAATNERNRKAAAAAEASRKRSLEALGEESGDVKRVKTDHPSEGIAGALASFDFTALPANLVTDLIIASLQAVSQQALQTAVQVIYLLYLRCAFADTLLRATKKRTG